MPNPWKKARAAALSRLVSGLGRPDRGASLVVQTGFPTSLADLVVKNRDRLKKPSRKKTPSSPRVPAVAAVEDAGRPVFRSSRDGDGGILEESPCSPLPICVEIKRNASGSGFGLLVVNSLVLMVLAIERRKLVAGITVSAFALFLLDFMGLQVFKFLNPCSNARRSLNSTIGELDLERRERVSPIREVGVESHVDSMPSDRNWEESSIDSDQGREILSERRDLAVGRNVGSSGNSKGKKFWRKFVPKKSNGSKKGKDEKYLVPNSSSNLNRRGEIDSITEEDVDELINAKGDKKDSNEEVLSFIASTEVTNFDKEEIGDVNREIIRKTRSGGPQQFVFFVIVLFGLAGGKAAAVILTVSWCLFIQLTETVCKK
ncbi:uncharacterized protein [Elaeis guineensis]|uniref:Uncharacterized protein LOC105046762 n=1 Tax=Elaeis guineensis var. tenera TaxID=51953 RepID=A0A6I9RII3_ELAGV|nr:uncharacterized protein LOC105046762 [Elaeis guineensis]